MLLAEIECDKKKSYSVKNKYLIRDPYSPTFTECQRPDKVIVTPILQNKTGFHLLELLGYRRAVVDQGAVYKIWFFKRPGAERAGSSKKPFFPSLRPTLIQIVRQVVGHPRSVQCNIPNHPRFLISENQQVIVKMENIILHLSEK